MAANPLTDLHDRAFRKLFLRPDSAGARSPSTVVVTHGLFVGRADEILTPMGIQRVFTTNTVMPRQNRLPVDICTLPPMLAEAIRRLHANESLEDLNSAVRQPR